ncbi:response regulator transcription factor [Paraburkholderia sp.]|uniref:response regulator transcription factor n=1 Tax=Paraburkholderia sp. TaxID=1926495 RepID=UPI003C6BD4E9
MRVAMLVSNNHRFESIKKAFDEDGLFDSVRFTNELSLLGFLRREAVDLVLLGSGREFPSPNLVLRWRNCYCRDDLPVIVMAEYAGKSSMMAAFDEGANDILVGQLCTEELLVRAKKLLKDDKADRKMASRIELGPFMLDRSTNMVIRDDKVIRLTAREFAIAWLFFSNVGKLLTKSQIAHTIWAKDLDLVSHSLEQHIYKLRCKLSLGDGSNYPRLSSAYSLGYKLEGTPEGCIAIRSPGRTSPNMPRTVRSVHGNAAPETRVL